jgi:hypothetical protein
MSNAGTGTHDLLDQAMCNEALAFRKRIDALEGDELFAFARILSEICKFPVHLHDTSIGDVIHAARNMTALDDAQHMIYNFTEGS